jgi:hypothetical protein
MRVCVPSGLGAVLGVSLAFATPALAADTVRPVTFSKDVAPILQAKCQECHQPSSIAPMSLITFEEVRPWARSMKDRVSTRQMPPWHIDKGVGVQKFKNDMSLSDEQIETIVNWVDQGAPQGNPKDLPAPKPLVTTNEWKGQRDGYGPPDLVVRSPEGTMPAVHQDSWWRPESEIPITEPRWVKMIEIRPTNLKARKIVHHAVAYLELNNDPEAIGPTRANANANANANAAAAAQNPDIAALASRPFLMEWAVGKGYDLYRPGTGKLLLPGEKIAWDQHIHAVGEEITGGTELGLWFYPKGQEPKHRSYLVAFSGIDNSKRLDIPPNSVTGTEGFTVLRDNTLITNFQPHFHLRGKSMQVEAILPTGQRQIVSYISNFNFNWMTNYIYDDDAAPVFPKGTIIHVTAFYDNTKANRNNPDPEQWVGYGDRTVDEMAHAWMNCVYLSDEEYNALVQERKAKTVNNTQQQQQQ